MTPQVLAKIPRDWTLPELPGDWWRDPTLTPALEICRRTTRHHAKSFYFASFPLPAHKRWAAFVVYAYCRHIDDLIDETPPDALAPTENLLIHELDDLVRGTSTLPFAPAFARIHQLCQIPRRLWEDLIHGCCLDRQPQRIETYPELELYCYYVASVVGLIMCRVFGVGEIEALPRAVEMGIAMQLTNILRDIDEDWQRGRCYLPQVRLKSHQLDHSHLDHRQFNDQWKQLMEEEVNRARAFYHRGRQGLKYIPNDGSRFCAQVMGDVYGGILDAIARQHFNPFAGRAFVPSWRKCQIAARCFLRKST